MKMRLLLIALIITILYSSSNANVEYLDSRTVQVTVSFEVTEITNTYNTIDYPVNTIDYTRELDF